MTTDQHHDYPHTPGSLPGCPPCDLEMARQAYVQIKKGLRCPEDIISEFGLEPQHRRILETAVRADNMATTEGIPVRDALHVQNAGDRTKALGASWVCPDAVGEWTGTREQRSEFRRQSDQRARERIEDEVLASCATLDPNDWSLEAQQVRESSASIRDHRMNALRQAEMQAHDREEELLSEARLVFLTRDEKRAEAERLREEQDWDNAALAAIAMKRADEEGGRMVLEAIEHGNRAKDLARQFRVLWSVNQQYDAECARRGLR